MVFEQVQKKHGGLTRRLGQREISIAKTSISFGDAFTDLFNGFDFVEAYKDFENNRIGFKPSNDKFKGFALQRQDERIRVKIEAVSKTTEKEIYEGISEDGFIIINVPYIHKE